MSNVSWSYVPNLKEGKLQIQNGYLQIPEKYLYLSNDILVQFIN